MSDGKVSINLVVLNGEKYIRHCLAGILAQTYPHEFIELNILDNGSTDKTKSLIGNWKLARPRQAFGEAGEIGDSNFAAFNFIEGRQNLGMWPGQEELLKHSSGKYVLTMAVDVILDKDFIKNSVEIMEKDAKIGALEAKIYRFEISNDKTQLTNVLDTCGFKVFHSRRVINIGHGEEDKGQYDNLKEIFGVEGAAPFLRKEAIDDCRVNGRFIDNEYFWYGDDLDFAWRMTLYGWKQVFAPSVIAWHDRQTTKKLKKNLSDFLAIRRAIPLRKRQLEWKNIRFTIIKNDYIINILKDLPYLLKREISMLGYLLIFEPKVLLEIPEFIKGAPKMFKERSIIMGKAVASSEEISRFFD